MKGFKKYEGYKDSGVEWIGEMPEKWEVKPLKRITCFISRGITPTYVDDSSVRVINQACIYWEKLNLGNIKYQKEDLEISKGRLYKGDLIINSTGTGTLGRAAIFNFEGSYIADTHVTIIRSDKKSLTNKYLFYLLQTPKYQGYIYSALVTGATNQIELSREGLSNTFIIYPKLEEQQAIANFLDQKTAEIDFLIADKEKLIELLQEQRQSIITQAVTKGIDPNVRMKDSGIEWIGEIPEHWKLIKINRLSIVKRGASPRPIDDPKYFDDNGEYSWVRISDVTSSKKYLGQTTQKLSNLGASLSVKINPGDLFISICATVGKPCITKIKCCIHDGFVYFPELRENKEFIYYIFEAGEAYRGLGKLGTQLNLNTNIIGSINIPLPSRTEQKLIVDFLNQKTAEIDLLITDIKNQITLLKEYRQSLITAAVTGKIDVRDYFNEEEEKEEQEEVS